MKMTRPPYIELLYDRTELRLYIDNADRNALVEYIHGLKIKAGEEYDLTIKKHRERKTKDQNGYVWELMGKLAQKLNLAVEEVYRSLIENMSSYEVIPIRTDAIESFTNAWKRGHIGRITFDLGQCKNYENYHNIRAHYSIQDFSKEEMSRFIDLVVQECKLQDIPTLTPLEIERLNNGVD